MRPRFHPFVSGIFFVGLIAALVWFNRPADLNADRDAMIGTWTDEAGPPGNCIRFYFVPCDIPGAPYATAYEGHVTLVNFLNHADARGSWNYGGWDPLTLNVFAGGQAWYVAIERLDNDHIRVRFGIDPEEMYRPGSLDHPDARVLTRIGWEPDSPFNRRSD